MNIAKLLRSEEERKNVLLWIDHREFDDSIVSLVATAVGKDQSLLPEWRNDKLWISYEGEEFRVPLTESKHDRYVTIGSIAKILEDDYEFWVETESLGGDTHGLLVLSHGQLVQLSDEDKTRFNQLFTPLELGMDYFSGLKIPHIGNVNNNPNFEKDMRRHKQNNEAFVKSVMESPEFVRALDEFKSDIQSVLTANKTKQTFTRRFVRHFVFIFIAFIVIYIIRYVIVRI